MFKEVGSLKCPDKKSHKQICS